MRALGILQVLLSTAVFAQENVDRDDGKTAAVEKVQEAEDGSLKAGSVLKNLFMGGTNHMEKQEEPQPLLVIGAGLPRTGTSSYKMALTMLGLKTYHMQDMLNTPDHSTLWSKLLSEHSITVDDILDGMAALGFNATIDSPTAYFYKELMSRYPNAKVVLTVRDSAEKWAASYAGTILRMKIGLQGVPFSLVPATIQMGHIFALMNQKINFPPDNDPSLLPDFYREWVAQVKSTVPADNLLVFNAKDGWGPLCDFLSPLAETIQDRCAQIQSSGLPYPYANESAKMQAVITVFETIALVFKALPLVLLACLFLFSARKKIAAVRVEKKFQ